MKLNPNLTWALVEERFNAEQNPITKRNLGLVLQHMKAEAVLDVDAILDTLIDEPKYVLHGTDGLPELNPQGSHDAGADSFAGIADRKITLDDIAPLELAAS